MRAAKAILCGVALGLLAASVPATAQEVPGGVNVVATGSGTTFTDANGMTLYTHDRDIQAGHSLCNQKCEEAWPPLRPQDGARPFADWTIIQRADGSQQWAYKNHPVYAYRKDAYPGARFGERPENEAWHVAGAPIETPSEVKVAARMGGKILVDARGLMLYSLDTDKVSVVASREVLQDARASGDVTVVHSGCKGACLAEWQPLEAAWIALPIGNWTVVMREDGSRQWAYQGKPLYTHPADGKNQNIPLTAQKAWRPVVLEPPSPLPSWVTLQETDGGVVLADGKGRTLYEYEAELNVNRPSGGASERGCDPWCMNLYVPVLATGETAPIGDWSVVTMADGRKQWGFKGMGLYTYTRDREPGSIEGTLAYRIWHTIKRDGTMMQGTGGG
jgi:predicted lipoprotein with Yx(FWY)xxD motif